MLYKYMIFIVFTVIALTAFGQDATDTPPVSPIRAALEQARQDARDGETDAAIQGLQGLFESGFTAVGVIEGDEDLARLAGIPAFDKLVADMSLMAYPCEHDADFRAFDFWIGEWDVQVAGGAIAGHNVIVPEQRGCLLVENWTSATGGGGTSINYLDRATGEWVQVWNDASGNQINIRGGLAEDGMLLVGTIHYIASDTTADFRGLWTPMADGRVRQFFEQSNDGGESWSPWFEGFYSRRVNAE